jgi:hypothetical protein
LRSLEVGCKVFNKWRHLKLVNDAGFLFHILIANVEKLSSLLEGAPFEIVSDHSGESTKTEDAVGW